MQCKATAASHAMRALIFVATCGQLDTAISGEQDEQHHNMGVCGALMLFPRFMLVQSEDDERGRRGMALATLVRLRLRLRLGYLSLRSSKPAS